MLLATTFTTINQILEICPSIYLLVKRRGLHQALIFIDTVGLIRFVVSKMSSRDDDHAYSSYQNANESESLLNSTHDVGFAFLIIADLITLYRYLQTVTYR